MNDGDDEPGNAGSLLDRLIAELGGRGRPRAGCGIAATHSPFARGEVAGVGLTISIGGREYAMDQRSQTRTARPDRRRGYPHHDNHQKRSSPGRVHEALTGSSGNWAGAGYPALDLTKQACDRILRGALSRLGRDA
jgi:hypothetical protein